MKNNNNNGQEKTYWTVWQLIHWTHYIKSVVRGMW